MNKFLSLLLLNLIWLNILDVITTWALLGIGGEEINFFQLYLNESGVTFLSVLAKMGAVVLMVFIVWLLHRQAVKEKSRKALTVTYIILLGLNIFYAFVVFNNVRMLGFQIEEVRRRIPL